MRCSVTIGRGAQTAFLRESKANSSLPMTTPARAFGDALRVLRKSHNLSQEALAGDAGLDRSHISRLERGQRSPTLDAMLSLCSALDISLVEMAAATLKQLEKHADQRA
jgi:DNA-binding XRE family transcriptional regulator